MHADQALANFLKMLTPTERVLDIGSGAGLHADAIRRAGHIVFTNDIDGDVDFCMDYMAVKTDWKFTAIWCSHVLEHIPDPHSFLRKVFDDLADDGLVAITVPPSRTKLVGGHINQFTPATLAYRMILAGFDCSEARVGIYGYNQSIIVKKRKVPDYVLNDLAMDNGDIARLASYFPWKVHQGIDQLGAARWSR